MSDSSFPLPPVRPPAQLDVFLLRYVDIPAAMALQQLFAHEVDSADGHRAALLLCEHPPCYSRGTAQLTDFTAEQTARDSGLVGHAMPHSAELIYHGPGQLAIYPVLSLSRMELSPLGYRRGLENLLAKVCIGQGASEVETIPGEGIHCRGGLVARSSAHIRNDMTQLGTFLNVSRDYDLGTGRKSTTLASASRRSPQVPQVKSDVISQLEAWFDGVKTHVYTRHPLLQRKRLRPGGETNTD
ncbi:MAG: lipoyl protein ligase domain-containing protein [Rubinisphaera brasiliensis]|uniref:lipoyl protein ligase domain-containing protein n=1 Tax=Rubinisphaera brasiliensis TaxID=119 RepID=UPI00391C388C